MPIILTVARAIEDRGPSLIRQLGKMGEQPIKVRFWGSYAGLSHWEDSNCILEEMILLDKGEGGPSA